MSFSSRFSDADYIAIEQSRQLDRACRNEVDRYALSRLSHAPVESGNFSRFPQQYQNFFGTSSGYTPYKPPTNFPHHNEFFYSGVPLPQQALETFRTAMPYTPPTNAAVRHIRGANEAAILSEWHSEWEIAEQSEQPWVKQPCQYGGRLPSLLTMPARIDMHVHERMAKSVVLNYWGGDEDAPEGAVNQHWRWVREAQEAMRRQKASLRRAAAARRFYGRRVKGNCSAAAGWQQGQPARWGVYYQHRV